MGTGVVSSVNDRAGGRVGDQVSARGSHRRDDHDDHRGDGQVDDRLGGGVTGVMPVVGEDTATTGAAGGVQPTGEAQRGGGVGGVSPTGEAGGGESGGPSGREVARSVIFAVVGFVLMLPAIGVMPRLGQWMVDHGPFVVMLPFMLWMMVAGGLLSSGVMKIIAAARS